jgi:hypothetical protein
MVIKRRWPLVYSITEFNKIFQEQLPSTPANRRVLAAARERRSFKLVLWPPFREIKTNLRCPRSNGDVPNVTTWLHRGDIQAFFNFALGSDALSCLLHLALPRAIPRVFR